MNLIKSEKEIGLMREAGKIWAKTMDELEKMLKVGVTTKEVDKKAEDFIKSMGGQPAFLNYKPAWAKKAFPASICASVNEVIVHGIPSSYKLKEGDLFTIDMGVSYKGFNVDAAKTFAIGKISKQAHQLMDATKLALERAIEQAKIGNTLGDIGYAISQVAKEHKFSIAEGLTGHGIGRAVHEEPTVFNYGQPQSGLELKEGLCLAIEPMFAVGGSQIVKIQEDESYATADSSLSAHFEHTIAITKEGGKILTAL